MKPKRHKYGNASQVTCYADGGKVTKKKKKKKVTPQPNKGAEATPEMLGSGAAAKAGDALKNRRQQQMDELGLKDGGSVKMKPPKKGNKPKKIGEGMNKPGGPYTPGAKGTYPKK